MALDPCCDRISGGLVYISVGDKRFEGAGDVRIFPRTVAREASASSGGRLVVVERAVPARVILDMVRLCDADGLDLYDQRCDIDVTVVEKSRGVRHLFTKSAAVGEPEENLSTGVLSGVEFSTDQYTKSTVT